METYDVPFATLDCGGGFMLRLTNVHIEANVRDYNSASTIDGRAHVATDRPTCIINATFSVASETPAVKPEPAPAIAFDADRPAPFGTF
jgi:hypothetical protein